MATTKTAKAAAPSKTAPKTAAKPEAKAAKSPKAAAKKPLGEGTSKLAEFLKAKKLDARRVLIASHELESLQPEDRGIKRAKRVARTGAAEGGEEKPKETRKPRSGRPVTTRALKAALVGGTLSGPSKTRILRAVNHLLEQKKGEKVDLRALF
jgi:hypothetical protein